MTINERQVGNVTILDLSGKMTLGEGDEILKQEVRNLIAKGRKNILLSMEGVPYIDSAGLGDVFRSFSYADRAGGKLKLLFISRQVEDLLSITRLITAIDIFDDEEKAVRSFEETDCTRQT